MSKPTVYIIEQQSFDYSPATVYGDIQFIGNPRKLAPDVPINSVLTDSSHNGQWNHGIVQEIRKELSHYMPGYDYIVPTGAPERILLVGMILSLTARNHKILKWDARSQRYLVTTLSLPAIEANA